MPDVLSPASRSAALYLDHWHSPSSLDSDRPRYSPPGSPPGSPQPTTPVAPARAERTATPEVPARGDGGGSSGGAIISSDSRGSAHGELACGGSPGPALDRVLDKYQVMRLLKRMRPDELREISQEANALEETKRAKLEDNKKVAAFVAKNDNFVDLVGDCYICLEPLLNNIGTTKFGVLSWRCRCTIARKAHSACVFSKMCHEQSTCDMCHAPMEFEKTRRRGIATIIHFHREAVTTDESDLSGDDSGADGVHDGHGDEEQQRLEAEASRIRPYREPLTLEYRQPAGNA